MLSNTDHPRCTVLAVLALALTGACATDVTDEQVDDLVMRSHPYVALYNVNNKFAARQGWNTCVADTELKDHTMTDIARPNNDTFYISCMLDLHNGAVILELPAFDSKYVSLMITGYDHYVNIPMSTRLGDFRRPERMLVYSARSPGYAGEPVEGVDRVFEASGDFVSAVIRLMPHASEPARLARITEQAAAVTLVALSAYRGGEATPAGDLAFPPFGATDADVFAGNLFEVMQFVMDHTTFDPANADDQALLAAYAPLGVAPGRTWDPEAVTPIDSARLRAAALRLQQRWLTDMAALVRLGPVVFQPKGVTTLEAVVATSVIGPIGMPQEEAVYPPLATADGEPMNALHDYVITMTKDQLPPAEAFWSVTLYDLDNGFFIPNDRKKYSVGENAGMRLDADGGIDIYVAAEQPRGVPVENWLPIERKDQNLNVILRIYAPDLARWETWTPPKAERIGG